MITEYLENRKAVGEINAVPVGVIARELAISRREVVRRVTNERRDGSLICAHGFGYGGYFMPSCIDEIITQRDKLEHALNTRIEVLEPFQAVVRAWVKAMNGNKGGVEFEKLSD